MAVCKVGEFAKSKAGHDKGEIFVIINIEEEYVFIVDGKTRKIEKPKKKKLKHIQVINTVDEELQKKLNENILIRDEDIKRAIKCYNLRNSGGC
jgi:ribosomal protein L14E/L6E/L27E